MSGCKHLVDGICLVATELAAGQPAKANESACTFCSEKAEPRQAVNEVTVSLAVSATIKTRPDIARAIIDKQQGYIRKSPPADNGARLKTIEAGNGVGSQLWRLLSSLGVKHSSSCSCVGTAERMNSLGPQGCRKEKAELVKQLKDNAGKYGWGDVAKAAVRALATGLAWRLDLTDVYGSLLSEAINLAERAAIKPPQVVQIQTPESKPAASRQKLVLSCRLCPGDLLTLTAALESLHRTYPDEYATAVQTGHGAIWYHNPWLSPVKPSDAVALTIEMHYPSIGRCGQESIPFLAGYTEYLGQQLGRPLSLKTNRPHLYLSPEEAARPLSQLWPSAPDLDSLASGRPIWLVNAGIKKDYTIKGWPLEYYQSVIDATADRICWVQIGLREHLHKPLANVVNLLDTGPPMRETIILAHRSAGGLGPVTFLQHLMAAWEKPYICLVGGREPSTWVQYPRQHTLHTIGNLDCCESKGCWRARVVPLGDGNEKDKSLCQYPVTEGLDRPASKCMAMIRPQEVLTLLERILH